jgi:glutamyl endopeptidase
MTYEFKNVAYVAAAPGGTPPEKGDFIAHPDPIPQLKLATQRAQIVFNPDLRKPVLDTTVVPFRMIAALLIDVGGPAPEYATGWFLSPSVIVTAAHALYYRDGSGNAVSAHSVRVIPGRNGSTAPFGVYDSTKVRVSASWLPNLDPSADYGAVQLDQPVGNTVGWFGCGIFTDDQLSAAELSVVGYPFDKPLGTMWGESGPVQAQPTTLSYRMSCYPGQSGAPLYALINGNAWVAGIHSGGQGSANNGVRITQLAYQELTSWRA